MARRSGGGVRKPPAWLWWMMAALPAALVVWGAVELALAVRGTADAEAVVGEVVSVERSVRRKAAGGSTVSYRVSFRYEAPWGEGLEAEPRRSDDDYGYEVGERVPLLVDPARPERAWINTAWGLWGDPVGLILGGIGFTWLVFWARRRLQA